MLIFDGFGLTVEGDVTDALVREAKQLAQRTRIEAEARKLLALRKYVNLADGGYAYSVKHGDILRVHIVPGAQRPAAPPDTAVEPLADFASGWITDGRIVAVPGPPPRNTPVPALAEFTPTVGTQRRLRLAAGAQPSRRFTVEPPADRPDLRARIPSVVLSQYARLRPSMYSGKMKKVVQAMMGFGKTGKPSAFRRTLVATGQQPSSTDRPTSAEVRAQTLGVRVLYDNRFYRTHGIATASDNKLWLVEVGTRGVLAIPLPLWPRSATAAFKEWCADNDAEAYTMLDELGGFPSGELLPSNPKLLDAQVRAGTVLRLATEKQMQTFYEGQPFASSIGWAFNESGTEAHNVSYRYNSQGLMLAAHWHAQFTIGTRQTPLAEAQEPAAALVALLRGRVSQDSAYQRAVFEKTPYLSKSTLNVLAVTAGEDPQAAFDALDKLEVTQVPGSCNVGRAYEGVVYHPSRTNPPPLKFHEPLLGGLASVYMLREGVNPNYDGVPMVQDVTVHVYFIGDALKAVKYYWDRNATPIDDVEGNFDDCMYQGNWEQTTRRGTLVVPVGFYTTDIDPRRAISTTEEQLAVEGRRLGRITSVGDDPSLPSRGFTNRTTAFELKSVRETFENSWQRTAVIVPEGVREGCLLIHEYTADGYSKLTSYDLKTLPDPWTYTTWRLFGKMSPEGVFLGGWPDPEHMHSCGNRQKRRVDKSTESYAPYPCSDLVDEGPWAQNCQVVEPANVGFPTPRPGSNEIKTFIGRLVTYLDFPPLGAPVATPTLLHEGQYAPWDANFTVSPDEFGFVQTARAVFNCLGDGNFICADTQVSGRGEPYMRGAPFREDFKTKRPTFVGVVNG